MAPLPFNPSHLQRLGNVGARAPQHRPLGKQLRSLAQRGLLSALLLLQLGQGALAQGMTTPDLPPPPKEVAAQVTVTPDAASVQWFNPLATARTDLVQAGGMDGFEVIQSWRTADIDPSTMHRLTEVLVLTQSPIFTRDQATLDRAHALSERTSALFSLTTQAQAEDFLAQHNPDKLVEAGLLSKDKVAITVANEAGTDFDDTLALWSNYAQLSQFDEPAALSPETETGMAVAIQNLSQAVDATGLNSLSVPLPLWTSPQKLNELATKLTQSNEALSSLTGWNGPVLGLGGRVDLTMGMPYDVGTSGPDSTGKIAVQSEFDALGHEWSHALEQAMSQDPSTASMTAHVMETLAARLDQDMPSWRSRVSDRATDSHDHADFLSSKQYLERNTEKIAYAFSGYLNARLGEASPLYMAYAQDSWRPPTVEEASHSTSSWNEAFATLNAQWWNPQQVAAATQTPSNAPTRLRLDGFVLEIPAIDSLSSPPPAPVVADTTPSRTRLSTEAFASPSLPSAQTPAPARSRVP